MLGYLERRISSSNGLRSIEEQLSLTVKSEPQVRLDGRGDVDLGHLLHSGNAEVSH